MLIKKKLKIKAFKSWALLIRPSERRTDVKPNTQNQETLEGPLFLAFKKLAKKKEGLGLRQKKNLFKYRETPLFGWVIRRFTTTTAAELQKDSSKGFLKHATNKNIKTLQLQIILKSRSGSKKHTTDLRLSTNVVVKLIDYLNYFCTKSFKNIIYFRKKKYKNFFDAFNLANARFNELFLGYSTATNRRKFPLKKQKKGTVLQLRSFNPSGVDQVRYLCGEVVQKNNYSSRYFFKWCELFASNHSINKQMHKPVQSTKQFTVVRSPFVFKKTREQFSSQKLSYRILVKLQNPMQKLFLIQSLGLLRLPCELDILDY